MSGRADASLQTGGGRLSPFVYDPDARPFRDAGDGTYHTDQRAVLDTRPDWLTAVRREDARTARYERPASVILLELTGEAPGPHLDSIARDLADVIRMECRSTDRAVRYSARSFRILLPETSEESARVAAARLKRSFGSRPPATGYGLRVEVVTSSGVRSLTDALAAAEQRLGTGPSQRDLPSA